MTTSGDDDSVDKILNRMHIADLADEADIRAYLDQRPRTETSSGRHHNNGGGSGGSGGGRNSGSDSHDNSLYDSNDGDDSMLDILDRVAIEDDDDEEEEEEDREDDDDDSDMLDDTPLSGSFVSWNEIAAQQRHMNQRRMFVDDDDDDDDDEDDDGIMLDDDDDDDDENDEESVQDQGERANRMQVVNAAGRVLGAYMPPRAMALSEAYTYLNPPPPPPAFLKRKADRDPVPKAKPYEAMNKEHQTDKGEKRPREEDDSRAVYALTDLMKELRIDTNDPAIKTLLNQAIGNPDQNRGGEKKQRRADEPDTEEAPSPSSLSDDEYIERHFADLLRTSRISVTQLRDLFCPVCGFGNIINEEPVRADVFEKIQKLLEIGVMSISIETVAFIASELWNDGIFRPMKKADKRMLPFSYKMAYEHLTRPHRPDPRPDHRADIDLLTTTAKTASTLIFYQDNITGRVRYDPKAYNMMASALRLKNILRKTLPEKMAYYNPRLDHSNATSSGLVNPMRTIRYTSANNAGGGPKHNGLGGRQVGQKK